MAGQGHGGHREINCALSYNITEILQPAAVGSGGCVAVVGRGIFHGGGKDIRGGGALRVQIGRVVWNRY